MIARIYNALLGGKDHYAYERLRVARLQAAVPDAAFVFRSEIAFLHRAARAVAARGITQWVVALAGLLPDNGDRLEHVVRRHNRDARVWYVDYEPVVLVHLRALVGDEDSGQTVRVVDADPLNPATVWNRLASHPTPIEADEPICLVLGGVLSYHPGTRADAITVAQQHIARLPPGSFVVLTHLYDPEDPKITPMVRRFRDALGTCGPCRPASATRDEIRAMVAGTTILPPAPGAPPDVVPANLWWRDGPIRLTPAGAEAPEPASGPLVAGVVATIDPG
ncbi:SAM-dependent methyltransferase [Amycolatopsis sp. NEAU-NG30]|uniref:SAM-dependent methyltransferase n=1 Tax=Amycolatopsis melonis TaxID=3156488 RepID=A0ABV0LEK2_9PSEU